MADQIVLDDSPRVAAKYSVNKIQVLTFSPSRFPNIHEKLLFFIEKVNQRKNWNDPLKLLRK
jgi:hypothetical protein